jgi:hypothetical protein
MTLWEFEACMEGLRMFHGGKKPAGEGLTEEEARQMGIEGFGDDDE